MKRGRVAILIFLFEQICLNYWNKLSNIRKKILSAIGKLIIFRLDEMVFQVNVNKIIIGNIVNPALFH